MSSGDLLVSPGGNFLTSDLLSSGDFLTNRGGDLLASGDFLARPGGDFPKSGDFRTNPAGDFLGF